MKVEITEMQPEDLADPSRRPHIRYGATATPFGHCVIAVADDAICQLDFISGEEKAETQVEKRWPDCQAERDDEAVAVHKSTIDHFIAGTQEGSIRLLLKGSYFQRAVWRALLTIPHGKTVSYGEVARRAGYPTAMQAVGTAVGSNPISLLVPCHRVVRSDGGIGGYYWGLEKKTAILKAEGALTAPEQLEMLT